jgi:hypothetical protein
VLYIVEDRVVVAVVFVLYCTTLLAKVPERGGGNDKNNERKKGEKYK